MKRLGSIVALLLATLFSLLVPPPAQAASSLALSYSGYVAGSGWRAPVGASGTAGTTGRSLALRAVRVTTPGMVIRSNIRGLGWQSAHNTPATAGIPGGARALDAIRVSSLKPGYTVKCQAHVQGLGWLKPVGASQTCGTVGRGLRLEAIRLWYVPTSQADARGTVTYSVREPARAKTTASGVNIRTGAGTGYRSLGVAGRDVDLQLTGRASGVWKQVLWRGTKGWVHSKFLRLDQPAGKLVTVTVPRTAPVDPASRAGRVIAYAKAQLGKPYVWAGNGPAVFDCSGLTKAAYARVGVQLARYSGHQMQQGRAVAYGQWQPGDLLFWGGPVHHVGIYLGNGMMISAKGSAWGVVSESVAEHMAYDAGAYAGARRYV